MAEQKSYPVPPITEAVIEIRFEDSRELANLQSIAYKLEKYYGLREKTENRSYNIDLAIGELKTSVDTIIRLTNNDQDQIAILAPDKIIVSQLAVYPGWQTFYDRFLRDWKACKSVFGYRKITRVGMRYINRIDVPPQEGICRYEDYLALHVKLPDFLDPARNFSLRIEKPFDAPKCIVAVASNPMPSPFPHCGAFLLDIDAGCTEAVPQRDDALMELLENLRHLKNQVFEASITDLSRERLKDGIWLG